MHSPRTYPPHTRPLFAALLLAGCLLLASCSAPQVPEDAIVGLLASWQSLPGSATHHLTVLRAWPGQPPSDVARQLLPAMQVWCVETELSPKAGASTTSESMIWFVTKAGADASWEVVPLAVLSSTWPYEACQANDS